MNSRVSVSYSTYEAMSREEKRRLLSAVLGAQGGKCALCGDYVDTRIRPGYMGPVMDHDHQTNRIRGVLHPDCNLDLEVIESRSTDWQERARDYLRRFGPTNAGLGP